MVGRINKPVSPDEVEMVLKAEPLLGEYSKYWVYWGCSREPSGDDCVLYIPIPDEVIPEPRRILHILVSDPVEQLDKAA